MPFLNSLRTEYLGDGKRRLINPLTYQHPETGERITAKYGFVTDFASIPQIFRSLITGNDNTVKPAVIHDWLYGGRIGKRKAADQIFLTAMKEMRVPWWKRHMCYAAVRAGGWVAWRS